MKRKDTMEIAGNPPTSPPSALPYLSAISVAKLTHAPPTVSEDEMQNQEISHW
jgi:hypothetical protein